jgi:hypothetical protein
VTSNPDIPYRYYVAYAHTCGFGSSEVSLKLPVRSIADVNVMADAIRPAVPNPFVITNFVLMSGPHNPPGATDVARELDRCIDWATVRLADENTDRQITAERLLDRLTTLRDTLTPTR